jgi:hypothetical protein
VCEANTDCPPGWACVTSCCGQTCAPPCGTCADSQAQDTSGATASGQ